MSKDISTEYTKKRNNEEGRRGYGMWKLEKITDIPPKNYGMFLQNKRRNSKTR